LRIGSWDVLSLYKPEALKMLLEQLDSCKEDITGAQELRWMGKELWKRRIMYSTAIRKRVTCLEQVLLLVKQRKHLILDFQAKSHRTCRLRIKGKFFSYSLICAHSPIEDKDPFYDELDEIYSECPRRDCKIIIGAMNAKVGNEDVYRSFIGKYSLHNKTRDNGMRLINFASSRNMVVGSTMFSHKDIHKRTWKSPDGNVFNQTDHILTDARHFSYLMDVRSCRGPTLILTTT
jgi:hypothetical protein